MLGLPKSTELNQPLPKTAIFARFQMNAAEKTKIDADISRIVIVNEVSAAKLNLAPGKIVQMFFVLQVQLKRKEFSEKTLITLSKLILSLIHICILQCRIRSFPISESSQRAKHRYRPESNSGSAEPYGTRKASPHQAYKLHFFQTDTFCRRGHRSKLPCEGSRFPHPKWGYSIYHTGIPS